MDNTYAPSGTIAREHHAATAATPRRVALEDDAFPFEALSEIAQLESWRKEVNRPIYHLHKWWAQRLGSVFRAVLIGAAEHSPDRILHAFYEPSRYPEMTVFDPFMGSGTTVGEALKLGMRAIGRDINPVATFGVQTALADRPQETILETFHAIERDVAPLLKHYYRATQPDGAIAQTLYYFWVKVVPCPACDREVALFSSYVFAKHAYPARVPTAQVLCPTCGEVQRARHDATAVTCTSCQVQFNPQCGPVKGQKGHCPHCHEDFLIAPAVRFSDTPPAHRMYAKLVLHGNGEKEYQRITDEDRKLYTEAIAALAHRPIGYPLAAIQPGHNTNQVLNYRYRHWHEMFNARQLLCLSLLGERIKAIDDPGLRQLFTCLFSGSLEFNNMFASFKGEGTGAVRHMFSHHILKPERTPLEANVWGTPKSSGAFSTLFRSRLLRAMEYRDKPFEVKITRNADKLVGEKVFGLSAPMGREIVAHYTDFALKPASLYLSCGDSASTDIPDASIDLIVTDPPFFDNVHYSELADFFHVWQRELLAGGAAFAETTRASGEVQSRDVGIFSRRLQGVFRECRRIIRPGGLLVFSYHHSRPEGWQAVLQALRGADFVLTAVQPITTEMSGATPKAQAKEPISLDIIMVCRPRGQHVPSLPCTYEAALEKAEAQVARFRLAGRHLSRNDLRVIIMAQLLRVLALDASPAEARCQLAAWGAGIDTAIERLYALQRKTTGRPK